MQRTRGSHPRLLNDRSVPQNVPGCNPQASLRAAWEHTNTIIPNPGDPVAYDRYAYARNSPVKYSDPSGHGYCDSQNSVEEGTDCKDTMEDFFSAYGITLVGGWTNADKNTILRELGRLNAALAPFIVGDPTAAFQLIFGEITLSLSDSGGVGCDASSSTIVCGAGTAGSLSHHDNHGLFIHELGHRFNASIANNGRLTPYNMLKNSQLSDSQGRGITYDPATGEYIRTSLGYRLDTDGDVYPYRQNPYTLTPNEDFADMFMNWAFDSFDYSRGAYGAGEVRYAWMATNMEAWVLKTDYSP